VTTKTIAIDLGQHTRPLASAKRLADGDELADDCMS
jgi:hypothetical protein